MGILEQFDDSLKLFEKLIPKFFKGAPHALVSEQVQNTTTLTKTKNKISMSTESRQYLASGPLKYEVKDNFAVFGLTVSLFRLICIILPEHCSTKNYKPLD